MDDHTTWPDVSTKETTPKEAEAPPLFAIKKPEITLPYALASSSSASRSAKSRSGTKKRKLDWNRRDEDDDYVSRIRIRKQKQNRVKKHRLMNEEETDIDAELLLETVEKRRSARNLLPNENARAKYGVIIYWRS